MRTRLEQRATKQEARTNAPNLNQNPSAQTSCHNPSQELEKRLKQQMESMEQRMMDAKRKMFTSTRGQNNQAKAVRTSEETSVLEMVDPDASAEGPQFSVRSSAQPG